MSRAPDWTHGVFEWQRDEARVAVSCDGVGRGQTIVFLPALSSISTRREMWPLMDHLSPHMRAVTVDWPGFGDLARAKHDCSVDGLSSFLDAFLAAQQPQATAMVAAGHAASYALQHVANQPGSVARLVLVAPTWRGPFPTMAGGRKPVFDQIVAALDMPVLGHALYRLNVSGPVLRMMAREHVYQERDWLDHGDRFSEKRAVTMAKGARHASARFVAGQLDPVETRAGFLDLAQRAAVPILVIVGGGTPRKSLAEMEALASLPNVQIARFPRGRLSIHEEFPDDIVDSVTQFLAA